MKKSKFISKSKEEAIKEACESLQELEKDLVITEKEVKQGLFGRKIEVEVIAKRDIIAFIKDYLKDITKKMGLEIDIETKYQEDVPTFIIYSNNNAILIGRNGQTLNALTTIVKGAVKEEIGMYYPFTIDVAEYKQKREKELVRLAHNLAKEVKQTGVEIKLDPMNSYERRIIHNALTDDKEIFTESVGEEPHRAVMIKLR